VRLPAGGSGTVLLSPKLSSAPAPNRATRATIAFAESDRPGGREPTMPMPRTEQSTLTQIQLTPAVELDERNGAVGVPGTMR